MCRLKPKSHPTNSCCVGFIRRVGSGIYAYLPMMWKVLQRITTIIREEMNRAGARKHSCPSCTLGTLAAQWAVAGLHRRGRNQFHLEDRQGRELGLGPTHEEVITSLAGEMLRSYRQLP